VIRGGHELSLSPFDWSWDLGLGNKTPGGHVKTLKSREQRETCHAGTTYSGLAGVIAFLFFAGFCTLFFTVIQTLRRADYSVQYTEYSEHCAESVLNQNWIFRIRYWVDSTQLLVLVLNIQYHILN